MIYFMKKEKRNEIKIGKSDNPPLRRKTVNTSSSEKVALLLAIHVLNEDEAEKKLHTHFREYRLNGEWFEINFTQAVRALLELNLVPNEPQPILSLPVVPPVPPIHPEFRRWWFASSAWEDNDEGRNFVDENIERLWLDVYAEFEKELREHQGDVEAMFAAKIPREEMFRGVIDGNIAAKAAGQ